MSKSATVTRIDNQNRDFMGWANWSTIQSRGPIDDGRLAAMASWCACTLSGRWAIYYRDNGQVFFAASSMKSVEIARAYTAGWQRSLDYQAIDIS